MIHYGADRVITVEHPHLKQYTSDGFSQAFMAVYEQEKPDADCVWSYSTRERSVTENC